MSPLLVFACVLQTVEGGAVSDPRCDSAYVHELVSAVTKYSARYGVPAHIEVAKMYHESLLNKHARGKAGEIGLGQLLRHGAIQGRDLRLTTKQLEDVDTNVRIGTWYLSQFVRQCDKPSQWLTKYNRPARGCRASRYSAGVLSDLKKGRTYQLKSNTRYDTEASGFEPLQATLPYTTEEQPEPDHTSHMPAGTFPATPQDIGERHPSGMRRVYRNRERTLEESLAAPFAEP